MYQHGHGFGPRISRLVAQFPTQYLADRGLRKVVAELDDLRPLVAREVGLAIRPHCGFGDRGILAHDDELHGLARLLVGNADGRAFEDARHLRHDVFDLRRINVEAADQNHVLLAIDYSEIATPVDHADVAAAEK